MHRTSAFSPIKGLILLGSLLLLKEISQRTLAPFKHGIPAQFALDMTGLVVGLNAGQTKDTDKLKTFHSCLDIRRHWPEMTGGARVSYFRIVSAQVLKFSMGVIVVWWLALWVLRLFARGWKPVSMSVTQATDWKSVYGNSAGYFLLFDAPVFAVVLLAALYLQLKTTTRAPQLMLPDWREGRRRVSPFTYPLIIHGPLGIVTAAELLALASFLILLSVIEGFYWKYEFEGVAPRIVRKTWQAKVDSASHKTGHAALVCLAIIFFPVARGSILLRLVDIPFDQAVKYHKWLANIMMVAVVAHGITCSMYTHMVGHSLWASLCEWNKTGFNNLAGTIAAVTGILIWATSLPQARKHLFEVFSTVHQLYIIFVVFTALHVGEKMFDSAMAGIFLFFLDRLLRFTQSQKAVSLLSVRSYPGDTVELVLARHPSLKYTSANFLFVRIPTISRWQWHPFTITSISSVGDRMNILVKAVKRQGAWTHQLKQMVDSHFSPSSSKVPPSVSVEGPYGHHHSYFLRYRSLILVAGGSGITPFIAMLQDILQRPLMQQPCLPEDVTLTWAVKTSSEILVLTNSLTLPPTDYTTPITLDLQAFVTDKVCPNWEEDHVQQVDFILRGNVQPPGVNSAMSNWGAVTIPAGCVLGYLCIWGAISHYHVQVWEPEWARTLLRLLAIALAAAIFGGVNLLFSFAAKLPEKSEEQLHQSGVFDKAVLRVHSGQRPNLEEMFEESAKRLAGEHVGVFVCGPEKMQQSVAEECRRHSSLLGSKVAFHFHCLSFHL